MSGLRNSFKGCKGFQCTHGMYGTPTYMSYHAMKNRCLNKRTPKWSSYGGRGITICEKWLGKDGFSNFIQDMGVRPKGKTLDRFPNKEGNYEPGNTRWATVIQQNKNRSNRVGYWKWGMERHQEAWG